jgi:antitoxin (DNA-binding transcriptional repressor) of toxin-antitoxin stability system
MGAAQSVGENAGSEITRQGRNVASLIPILMNAPAGSALMVAGGMADSFAASKDAGKSTGDAIERAGYNGLVTALTLSIRVPGLNDKLAQIVQHTPTAEIPAALAEALSRNGAGMVSQSVLMDAYDKVAPGGLNPNMSLEEMLQHAGTAAKDAAILTAVAPGVPLAAREALRGARYGVDVATSGRAAADASRAINDVQLYRPNLVNLNPNLVRNPQDVVNEALAKLAPANVSRETTTPADELQSIQPTTAPTVKLAGRPIDSYTTEELQRYQKAGTLTGSAAEKVNGELARRQAGVDSTQRLDAGAAGAVPAGEGVSPERDLGGRVPGAVGAGEGQPEATGPGTPPAGGGEAAPAVDRGGEQAGALAGDQINRNWTAFSPESRTLGIPRADMPQIAADHRGAFVNFLEARGVTHEAPTEVPADSLKPTQAEYSPPRVERAGDSDRSVLVSSDGYVLDGHHQWLAKLQAGEPVKVIKLNAPIQDLLRLGHQFPSSFTAGGRRVE